MNKTILLGTVLLAACASGGSGNTDSSPPESASGDVLPRLVNKEFFERLMEREYSQELRFTPALNNGKALPVKIAFTVTFSTRDSLVPVSET